MNYANIIHYLQMKSGDVFRMQQLELEPGPSFCPFI